jgi:hypothetical protein
MSAFANSGPTLQESFQHILGPQGFTLADFDLDKLTRILYALVLNAAKKVTIATQALVEKLIDSVAGFVDLLRRILFATISFPFIEKTFALLTGKPLDTGVRLIDIILLVALGARHGHLQTVHGRPPLGAGAGQPACAHLAR